MEPETLLANDVTVSDWVRPISGCGCPSCGRIGDGFKADNPQNDPTIASGTTDTVPATIGTSFVITPGGSVTGTINPLADRDWYAIDLVAGQQYTFNLNGTAGAMGALSDPFLRLYNAAGTLITQNDDATPGSNLNSQITFLAETSGRYYLAAGGFDDVVAGSYTLLASAGTTPPPANPLDSLNFGTVRTLGPGNVINVYFAQSGETFSGETANRNWTAQEIAQSMLAFQQFSNVINVTFQQVTNSAQASFRLVQNGGTPGSTTLGWFEIAGGTTQVTGWFDNDSNTWTTGGLAQGTNGFVTLVHEFGHGMGIAHPHDNGGSSTVMQGVTDAFGSYGTGDLNQNIFTVMSYNRGWNTGPQGATPSNDYGHAGTLMALDIATLQQDYGANTSYRTGNDIYDLPDANQTGTFYSCIWDAGGTDTIRYTGNRATTIDLRAATLTQTSSGGGYISFADTIHGGFTIASGVVIENATGGSGNDTITGNSADNTLTGGGGSDTLTGGAGNDLFVYASGAVIITDFVAAGTDDRIDLRSFTSLTTFSAVLALGVQSGSNTVFTFSAGNTLTLSNVTRSALVAGDFILSGQSSNNTITGTASAETLTGTTGADTISGLGGNDIIDGRGGGDTIAGGDNDDTIYYYASDTAANITGGNGTDTLLVINGSAPTGFNLAAQGFEGARHDQTDTTGQAWSTITDTYNASWQMLTSNRVNDDATRRFTTYDRANAQTWASSEEEYNASGQRYEIRTYYDDGTRRTTGYDVANAQTYASYEEDFNVAGARTALRTYYDDGTRRTTGYDTTGLSWSTYEEDYNAAGQRTALRTYNDDGSRRTTQWDPASGQTWSLIEEYFNTAGTRFRQITDYDDGNTARARLDTSWDVTNTQAWSVQTTQTNNLGVVVRVYGTLDNGSAFG